MMRLPISGQALTSVDQVYLYFHFASRVCHPKTRAYVRLLGPCFKTGRLKPFRQHPKYNVEYLTVLLGNPNHQHAVNSVTSKGDQAP